MPNIFDTLAAEEPATDQLPEPASQTTGSGNVFDQIHAEEQGNIFDQIHAESQPRTQTPLTDQALNQSREAMRPKVTPEQVQGVLDIVKGIPGMVAQLPEAAYQGFKFASGMPQQQREVALDVLKKVIPEGQQLAADVNAPAGSREWTRGMIQLGMLATPGLELARELRGARIEPKVEPPPVQPRATTTQTVGWERRFQMVEPPPEAAPELAAAPTVEETLAATAPRVSPETGAEYFPEAGVGGAPEVPVTAETARIGGEQPYAIEPSYAQVEEPPTTLGVKEGTGGAEPPAGRSDYAIGEAQGAEAGGGVPPQEAVEPAATAEAGQAAGAPPVQVGISQARTEAELGAGSVEPGVGAEMGSGLEFGRKYINEGGDPRLPIRRATASGLVGRKEVGIVHAELERLRGERNAAAQLLEANPDNPTVRAAFDAADTAQRAWRKELQPVLTKASDALREAYAQSVPDADPATYQGLADIFDEHYKGTRDISPEMRTAMAKGARGVRQTREIANGEMAKVEQTLTRQLPKGKRVMTPEELDADLRSELENQFKDCVIGG
jgi:hypothetical protein